MMKAFVTMIVMLLMHSVAFAQHSQPSDVEDNFAFSTAQDRQRFLQLTAELRCPMCQNQNIADSDAMIARDMRRKVYQLLQQGQTDEQVITYMKERYGDFVSYSPPLNAATVWLWLTPVLFIVVSGIVFASRRRRAAFHVNQDDVARAEALLKQEETE